MENNYQPQNQGLPPEEQSDSIFSESTRQHYAEQIKKESAKALAFGLLSFLCCPPIMAYFAYNAAQDALTNIDIYQVEHGRKSMAQAGKILGITAIIVWTVSIILRLILESSQR